MKLVLRLRASAGTGERGTRSGHAAERDASLIGACGILKACDPYATMGHKTRYSEIVLVGLVATLASYNYTITIDNFALPHKVAMYSVKPVLQHDSAFDVFDVAHSAAKTHHFHDVIFDAAFVPVSRSGDFDFHYMTAIQIAKFSIGCYSNNSLTDTVRSVHCTCVRVRLVWD